MMPGNHDAVRPAEPQPTFPEGIKELFDPNIHFVGNPCHFTLNGIGVLAYHGMSIYDYIGAIQKLTYENPLETMKEMLKRRHLAPIYGGKTPIAPENEDYLVVDPVPDIFVTGHVHSIGVEKYKGTLLINASAWQSQTPYQKMRNFQPKPAKAVIVDLSNRKHQIKDFLT
jgi:DNA polymerase II small subunit